MGRDHRDGERSRAESARALIALLAALFLVVAGPFGPDLPPLQLDYLGPPLAAPGRPDDIDGFVTVPAEKAVAILFKGAFDFGGTDTLTKALDAAPNVSLVAFDSPGGRPLVADGVAQLLRERHLDTTVRHSCASACTIAYVAGTLRTASPGARFGFHLGTGPVFADLAMKVVLQVERRWFVRGGASLTFAERALHAPNPEPYFAPLEELMAAGYVHRINGKSWQGTPIANQLLAAVAAIEPQTARALQAGQAQRVSGGMPAERSAAIAEQRATLVVDRWFAHSSDTAILALVNAMVDALDDLGKRDAYACMRWQIGLDDQDLSLVQLPPTLRLALTTAQIHLLQDATAFPIPLPVDDGALAGADAGLRREIAAKFGARAMADAASREHGFDDPGQSCAVSTAYLRGLRQRPESPRLLRWALGAG